MNIDPYIKPYLVLFFFMLPKTTIIKTSIVYIYNITLQKLKKNNSQDILFKIIIFLL